MLDILDRLDNMITYTREQCHPEMKKDMIEGLYEAWKTIYDLRAQMPPPQYFGKDEGTL